MGLLFLLSHQPDVADPFDFPDWLPVDKLAHAGLYAVLGALFYLAGLSPLAAVMITGLYGVTDELHQAFVPGRQPELLDLLADIVGAAAGVWLVRFPARAAGVTGESVE